MTLNHNYSFIHLRLVYYVISTLFNVLGFVLNIAYTYSIDGGISMPVL